MVAVGVVTADGIIIIRPGHAFKKALDKPDPVFLRARLLKAVSINHIRPVKMNEVVQLRIDVRETSGAHRSGKAIFSSLGNTAL